MREGNFLGLVENHVKVEMHIHERLIDLFHIKSLLKTLNGGVLGLELSVPLTHAPTVAESLDKRDFDGVFDIREHCAENH